MADNENVKVNQEETTQETTTQETAVQDNTLVVPTTEEKKPSKAGKVLKIAGAVAGGLVTVGGAFLLGKFFGGKGGSGSGS